MVVKLETPVSALTEDVWKREPSHRCVPHRVPPPKTWVWVGWGGVGGVAWGNQDCVRGKRGSSKSGGGVAQCPPQNCPRECRSKPMNLESWRATTAMK